MSISTQVCPKAFVLGHPIKHSKSPLLHRAAYRAMELEMSYEALDTTEDQLGSVFDQQGADRPVRGFSVTMPLKSAVKEYLDELTPFAQAVGVVNTVYWQSHEAGSVRAYGHNTDVSGIVNALGQTGYTGPAVHPAIIGGGGTATAALAALRCMGATSVTVYVRDPNRAGAVRAVADRLGVVLEFQQLTGFTMGYSLHDVVICTLPSGAADTLLQGAAEHPAGTLLDVSYDPWPSVLAAEWETRNGSVTSGLEMLMYQAVDQVKLFTGHQLQQDLPRQDAVLRAMREAVGLPASDYVPQKIWEPSLLTI
ncbi:shikimate dehydrogenase [Rothia nasimurium]|uniref:shikimate dehydrogenase n=1 Tax=Rothia nasimurium TaxID=85336 RepID=UPI003BA184F8